MYGKDGQPAEARAILAEFDTLTASGRYASAYAVGVVHAGLGDRERALSSLAKAYQERSHWLVWLKRDLRWNESRSEERFHNSSATWGCLSDAICLSFPYRRHRLQRLVSCPHGRFVTVHARAGSPPL